MTKNDVVVVMTMAGEIIGKFVSSGPDGITLADPRTLMQNEQGMGFARGVCVAGKMEPTEMLLKDYVFATPVNEDFEKAYRQAVSGLVL